LADNNAKRLIRKSFDTHFNNSYRDKMNDSSKKPYTPRKSFSQYYPLIAGVIAFFLGPICFLSIDFFYRLENSYIGYDGWGTWGPVILYALGLMTSLGVGIFGVLNSGKAVEPKKARKLAITGIVLTLFSLWCPLVIWGSFAVLPCGVFGC
jgi:hypothetical protein